MDVNSLFDPDEAEDRVRGHSRRPSPSAARVQPVEHPMHLPIELYERWEERAAIREYDGGHSRDEAEKLALDEINQMLAEAARKRK